MGLRSRLPPARAVRRCAGGNRRGGRHARPGEVRQPRGSRPTARKRLELPEPLGDALALRSICQRRLVSAIPCRTARPGGCRLRAVVAKELVDRAGPRQAQERAIVPTAALGPRHCGASRQSRPAHFRQTHQGGRRPQCRRAAGAALLKGELAIVGTSATMSRNMSPTQQIQRAVGTRCSPRIGLSKPNRGQARDS